MELKLKKFSEFIASQPVYKDVKGNFIQFMRYYLHTEVKDDVTADMLNNFVRKSPRSIYDEQQKRWCNANELLIKCQDKKTEYTIRCINNGINILIMLINGSAPVYTVFSPADNPDSFTKSIEPYINVEESESSEQSEQSEQSESSENKEQSESSEKK